MRRVGPFLVVLFLMLLVAGPAAGYHGTGDSCAGYDVLTFAVGDLYYLLTYEAEGPEGAAMHPFWLYRESNGIEGVQRGGAFYIFPQDDVGPHHWLDRYDWCYQGYPPDDLVYGF